LRFGDVLIAVATLFLITVLVSYPLETMLIPTLGFYWGPTLGALVSVSISSLIVGYIFARRIFEGRKESIARISVLFAVLMILSIVINNAALGEDFTQWVHETYQEANPTASLSIFEWYVVGGLFIGSQMFMNAFTLLPLSFIGLYIGSMLRKLKKS
jgi:phosphoglycerol transferase MdoB-like AlkP superfamily enzyme